MPRYVHEPTACWFRRLFYSVHFCKNKTLNMELQRMVTIHYRIIYYTDFVVPCGKPCLLQNSVTKKGKKKSLQYGEFQRWLYPVPWKQLGTLCWMLQVWKGGSREHLVATFSVFKGFEISLGKCDRHLRDRHYIISGKYKQYFLYQDVCSLSFFAFFI